MKKILFSAILLILISCSILIGPEKLVFAENWQLSATSQLILWHSRIPRTVSILLAGGSLSVAGLVMQTISQNRFAAPSTIGTVEAAKLGLLVSIGLFQNVTLFQKMLGAFVGAIVMTVFFFLILRRIHIKQQWTIPLFGIIFGQLINALTGAIAYHFDIVQSLSSWQQGSFSMVQNGTYQWLFLAALVVSMIILLHRPLTIMQLGRDSALAVGIEYDVLSRLILAAVCLIVSVNVITVGVLPFIGVIVPNVVRLFVSDRLAHSLPIVMMSGSIFVLACDLMARLLIRPYEIPVSILMTMIGGTIFIILVLYRRRGAI